MRVLVSGMIAGDPGQGGATWAVLQYVLGLRRLGHEVVLVEPVDELTRERVAQFRDVVGAFSLQSGAALLQTGTRTTVGLPYAAISGGDVLLNASGMLTDEALLGAVSTRVYLDLDPGFVQLWHAVEGIDMRFDAHTRFVTVGGAIGTPSCAVPTCGRTWIPTLPPVVLERWPPASDPPVRGITTVANWRGYGSIAHDGVVYGQKAHSVRALVDLPARAGQRFELALSIHPDETRDLEALRRNGWRLVDPREVAGTPASYRRYVQGSTAEIGIAKSGYVVSRCGWFSDRSACYLASGRPVIAQDTGFGERLPTGRGLHRFGAAEDVVEALGRIDADPAAERRAARDVAEEHLDSDRVLAELLRCL